MRCATCGLVLLSLAVGACSKPWVILQQARVSPFTPRDRLAIGRVTFVDLRVGKVSEREYLDRKKVETEHAWEDDKAAMARQIVNAMRSKLRQRIDAHPQDADFVLQVNIDFIEPGFNLGPLGAGRPAQAIARLWIEDPKGRVVDEIEVTREAGAGITIAKRLRGLGRRIGTAFAAYLSERLSAEPDEPLPPAASQDEARPDEAAPTDARPRPGEQVPAHPDRGPPPETTDEDLVEI